MVASAEITMERRASAKGAMREGGAKRMMCAKRELGRQQRIRMTKRMWVERWGR